MIDPPGKSDDSRCFVGGRIPGGEDLPAFSLTAPEPSAVPVLIAVPHAGRSYPPQLTERLRNPARAALKLEDRYADLLAGQVARDSGAALLVAHAPRAMVDLNRAVDDVDWEMFAQGRLRGADGWAGGGAPSLRVRSGLGLIPRRVPGLGELWRARHAPDDLTDRIEQIHAPYHACIASELLRLRDRWGAVLLIDFHSMPPLQRGSGQVAAEFVLGDRFGTSCHGALAGACFGYFAEHRRTIAHNRPYAGGYVLERHGDPAQGIHALQLEIDRSSYLDPRLVEPGDGFAALAGLLAGLVRRMAEEVAGLAAPRDGANWAEAAE